jgi:hypothetical protein
MGNKIETAPEEPISEGECCHYWIIETPQGPTSRGVCKFCGEVREFDNSGPDSWWGSDISLSSELVGSGLPDVTSDREQEDS